MSSIALRIAALLVLSPVMTTVAVAQEATESRKDVLLIERVQGEKGITLPARGDHMNAVRTAFGEPQRMLAAVGGGGPTRPPITRWVYPQFTVYFENDRVINAVLNKASPQEIGPKPID